MADLSGENLGPFTIESLLGTGGFATVYRAHDARLNDTVAIKILAENHALNAETRERFIAEAHALRRVSSSGVIQIYDIRETPDGRPYLVLEYADRGDLVARRQSLVSNGWIPSVADVHVVIDSLADALDAIHAESLVHRDVTPSNLLLRSGRRTTVRPDVSVVAPGERFMLSDMGLVKDLADGSALTVGGGTVGFWAPEQQQHLTNVDHRTDVYAATGLVAWLITGKAVGITPDWPTLVTQAGWPPAVVAALQRGLATNPDDRPQSIEQWKHELVHAFDATVAVAPEPESPEPESPELRATVPASTRPAAAHTAIVEPVAEAPVATASSKTVRYVAAALVAAAVVVAAVLFALMSRGDLNPTAIRLSPTEILVTADSGSSSLAIVGPDEITVGESVIYEQQSNGIENVIWRGPDGQPWTEDTLMVQASSPGQGTVELQGTTAEGAQVQVVLHFVARDGSS